MKTFVRHVCIVTLLFFLCIPSVKHILAKDYFTMHDDTQVGRVIAMGKALRNGQFPVRWVADLGYGFGYPIFNFYGPLPYYIGGSLYSAGIDAVFSTKAMFFLGVFGSGVVLFYVLREFYKEIPALITSLFYVFAPYHAVQIYIRGSVGEYYTLIFLPLILLAIWRLFSNSPKSVLLPGIIGVAGVVLSHTIMGFITVCLLIFMILGWLIFQLFKKVHPGRVAPMVLMVGIGLALSSFFWLPAIVEMHYTNVSGQIGTSSRYSDHFLCFYQLWESAWGFGGSVPGCEDGMSFKLGKLSVLVGVVSFILWLQMYKSQTHLRLLMWSGLIVTGIAVFFATYVSSPIWELIPLFRYIQYPWRFLVFANLGIALLTGGLFVVINSKLLRNLLSISIIALLLIVYSKHFIPLYSYYKSSAEFETIYDLRWRTSKISDEYLPQEFIKPTHEDFIALTTIPKSELWKSKTEIDTETYSRYIIESNGFHEVIIQRVYFPGWVYKVNGKLQELKRVGGLPIIKLEDGYNVVELQLKNTPIRQLSNVVSLSTFVAVLYFYYGSKTNT